MGSILEPYPLSEETTDAIATDPCCLYRRKRWEAIELKPEGASFRAPPKCMVIAANPAYQSSGCKRTYCFLSRAISN